VSHSARKERKVVTVVFADLVGFTARAETLDPEDVEAILSPYHARLRGELERFGGTVEKFIGDAVMAVFGAPVSREDDPERAVRAALAIRDWASESDGLEVRIAVATGEALVSLDVLPTDVVNAAERRSASERAVWSAPVVVVEPVWQGRRPLAVGAVDEPVGPFAGHRLVEALDLAVGARPVGLRRQMADVRAGEQLANGAAARVGPGIVGHQPADGDAVGGIEGERALEKAGDGACPLVRVDLGVGEPRVVVDQRVHDVHAVTVLAVL